MKNLLVQVSEVKDRRKIIKGAEAFSCELLADITKSQDMRISYTLSDCEEEILLEANVEGTIGLECSRCLENISMPVSIKICESYPATEENIDIGSEAGELLVLEVPMQPLCDENCRGICPVCGNNRNKLNCECKLQTIDPRWEKLRKALERQ